MYAVKEVKVRIKEGKSKASFTNDIHRMMDEAKFLAKLNHQNILRYYNSWLEGTLKLKKCISRSEGVFDKVTKKAFKQKKKAFAVPEANFFAKDRADFDDESQKSDGEDFELFAFDRSVDDDVLSTKDTHDEQLSPKGSSFEQSPRMSYQFNGSINKKEVQKSNFRSKKSSKDTEEKENKPSSTSVSINFSVLQHLYVIASHTYSITKKYYPKN